MKKILFALSSIILLAAGCGSASKQSAEQNQAALSQPNTNTQTSSTTNTVVGLPNPSSVFCVQHGGKNKGITNPDGSQEGLCQFKDGTECEEWDYYNGKCKPGEYTNWLDHVDKRPNLQVSFSAVGFTADETENWVSKDQGKYIHLEAEVNNVSHFSATNEATVFYIEDENNKPIQQYPIPPLKPGEYSPVISLYFPIENKTIKFVIDPDHTIDQAAGNNRCVAVSLLDGKTSLDDGMPACKP